MEKNVGEYDCRSCGACCGFFCHAPKYGRATVSTSLSERDVKRMPESIRDKLVQIERGRGGDLVTELRLPARKIDDEHQVCAFFAGEIGKSVCGCSIYEYRPFNCRYFIPDQDSSSCRMARSAYGIEEVVEWLDAHEIRNATKVQQRALEPYLKKAVHSGGLRLDKLLSPDERLEVGEAIHDRFIGEGPDFVPMRVK